MAKIEQARRLRHSAAQLEAEDEAMRIKHGLAKALRKQNPKAVAMYQQAHDMSCEAEDMAEEVADRLITWGHKHEAPFALSAWPPMPR